MKKLSKSFVLALLVSFAALVTLAAFVNAKPSGSHSFDAASVTPGYIGCNPNIEGWDYDLTGLAAQYSQQDATTVDYNNDVFYYRPCQPVFNQRCSTGQYPYPAGCLRDTRRPPQYHDLGALNTAQFSPRFEGPDQGFFISFTGGDEYRSFDIEFICDPDVGSGSLNASYPVENPQKDYHLQWITSFACPINNNNNNSNTTNEGLQCCLYDFDDDSELTKTLCLDTSLGVTECPSPLGQFELIGQWPVDDCSDCFFKGSTQFHENELNDEDGVAKLKGLNNKQNELAFN